MTKHLPFQGDPFPIWLERIMRNKWRVENREFPWKIVLAHCISSFVNMEHSIWSSNLFSLLLCKTGHFVVFYVYSHSIVWISEGIIRTCFLACWIPAVLSLDSHGNIVIQLNFIFLLWEACIFFSHFRRLPVSSDTKWTANCRSLPHSKNSIILVYPFRSAIHK